MRASRTIASRHAKHTELYPCTAENVNWQWKWKRKRSFYARSSAVVAFLLIVAIGLTVSACREQEGLSNLHAVTLNNPEKRHPITFTHRPRVLLVEIPGSGQGLSPSQKTDVFRFVRLYQKESTQLLEVSTPRRMRHHLAARHAIRDVEKILDRNGIGPSSVRIARHGSLPHPKPVLRISFSQPVAVAPRCGNWPRDVGRDRERVHYKNFGCATQRNFALTAANARDIMGPQPETPHSSERRDTIWREYVGDKGGSAPSTGATTSTNK